MRVEDYFKLNDEQINKFDLYEKMILEWNEKFNLTSITDVNDINLKHFIDSLTISKYINNNEKIIDIGTGAGFPGIPLKIYNDTLDITLIDSLNKRVNFLNSVIKELNLNNICAIHSRAEDLGKNILFREKYDVATSRAVASLNVLVEYLMPFIKVGGICICMKGPNIEEELISSKNAINILGGKIQQVDNFILPGSNITRNVIIIKKINKTNIRYPRKAGEPLKKPL